MSMPDSAVTTVFVQAYRPTCAAVFLPVFAQALHQVSNTAPQLSAHQMSTQEPHQASAAQVLPIPMGVGPSANGTTGAYGAVPPYVGVTRSPYPDAVPCSGASRMPTRSPFARAAGGASRVSPLGLLSGLAAAAGC